ncbi:MAG: hypothetical protein KC433_13320, partial [Anaerolineales bacterium]|nr:hypothetical protein [Anaerolineales bacterium]
RHGRSQILHANDHTLVYARTHAEETVWVALNASDEVRVVTAVSPNHQHTFTLQPWSGDVHCF